MSHGRIPVSGDVTLIMARLAMLRDSHNAAHPDAPILQRDIAEYIGLKSKSTLSHYENDHSAPSLRVLAKWLEFWGLGLYVAGLEEEDERLREGPADGAGQVATGDGPGVLDDE